VVQVQRHLDGERRIAEVVEVSEPALGRGDADRLLEVRHLARFDDAVGAPTRSRRAGSTPTSGSQQ
jgi:hypothetical protein